MPGGAGPALSMRKEAMANVVVVGAQWGDEGKGKIVDWLSERADIVVRFQGGHNAGHTLVIGNETYKLSLLPSGVVRAGKLSVIGNGVVIDPWALAEEIERLTSQGVAITPENLRVAENATLILPLHRELDVLREAAAGEGKIGTTGRGIGPAYEDKVGRRAIRVQDLKNLGTLGPKVDRILVHHNALRRGLGQPEIDKGTLMAELTAIAPKILPYMDVTWELLDQRAPRRQAHPVRGRAGRAARCRPRHLSVRHLLQHGGGAGGDRLGRRPRRARATCSASPRPTRRASAPARSRPSSADATGELLGQRGHEFGTVTGRKRRCGWFDACLVRQTVKTAGINGIALTKLDVLDGFETLQVCVGYTLDGERIDRLPAGHNAQARLQPIYESFEGWTQSTRGARSWTELPAQAVKYVRTIEELIECPVTLLSTSPERDDTILMKDPFED